MGRTSCHLSSPSPNPTRIDLDPRRAGGLFSVPEKMNGDQAAVNLSFDAEHGMSGSYTAQLLLI